MDVRLHVDLPLREGETLALPPGAARHVQVLRLQPGVALRLFDGSGAEWPATIVAMGRANVEVRLGAARPVDRELARPVTLAIGTVANERMDGVIEKATELGVAAIQPLLCMRSVLRLAGERAEKKRAHWQAVAVAACEQSGRARVPVVALPMALGEWIDGLGDEVPSAQRLVLSLRGDALGLAEAVRPDAAVIALSGPEGGLDETEEALARAAGFRPVSLGPRVLRADTAPVALMASLAIASS